MLAAARPQPAPPRPPTRCAACGAAIGAGATFCGGRFFCDFGCLERYRDALARGASDPT